MLFKTDKVSKDYGDLPFKNNRLYQLLLVLETYVKLEFNKDLTLTEIHRSKEEFDLLYSNTPVDKRPATSPHMRWEAADIRSSAFTGIEKQKMLKFLNAFTYQKGARPVALLHTIAGNVEHFHIQFDSTVV